MRVIFYMHILKKTETRCSYHTIISLSKEKQIYAKKKESKKTFSDKFLKKSNTADELMSNIVVVSD